MTVTIENDKVKEFYEKEVEKALKILKYKDSEKELLRKKW
jgi:hypothetical protein